MDTPLYKLYLFKRTPKYFELPAEHWEALRAQVNERHNALGIRDLINARMAWSDERFEFFGVEFYPSAEAAQAYSAWLGDIGYFQYIDSVSYLGIPMDSTYPDFSAAPAGLGETPIYRLYLSRPSRQSMKLTQDELDEVYATVEEAARRAGSVTLLSSYIRWNNEEWEYFGVERYPSLEAVIGYSQFLSSNSWYQFIQARSFLGVAYGGLISGI